MGQLEAVVNALAINVSIPEELQWTDITLTVPLLPDGHLPVKACGRPPRARRRSSTPANARHLLVGEATGPCRSG